MSAKSVNSTHSGQFHIQADYLSKCFGKRRYARRSHAELALLESVNKSGFGNKSDLTIYSCRYCAGGYHIGHAARALLGRKNLEIASATRNDVGSEELSRNKQQREQQQRAERAEARRRQQRQRRINRKKENQSE